MGQCADGFLMNTKLLDKIESFYAKYVKNNENMFQMGTQKCAHFGLLAPFCCARRPWGPQ